VDQLQGHILSFTKLYNLHIFEITNIGEVNNFGDKIITSENILGIPSYSSAYS
jgi:hypothetical protein